MIGTRRRKRLLAVASGGGHWIQLLRLMPVFNDSTCDCAFVCTLEAGDQVPGHRFYKVPDSNRWDKLAVLRMSLAIIIILMRERPGIVISTGAAPGYVAIRLGRLIGAKTIWLDSFANVEMLSMSGAMVGAYADLWLTQWEHLATPNGPQYFGSII